MIKIIPLFLFVFAFSQAAYGVARYGEKVCKQDAYNCYKVKKGETWYSLFPDAAERDLVKRLNRMNVSIWRGMTIAIPKNLSSIDLLDIAPFPHNVPATGEGFIQVNQNELAWGAYDDRGQLIKWGPMSGGKKYCSDVGRGCKTISGSFTIQRKRGAGCKSGKYPRPNGGAPMPYCMYFHGGYAMHGSKTVPGHHASHGCVRMYTEDARWLNLEFVKTGITKILINRRH